MVDESFRITSDVGSDPYFHFPAAPGQSTFNTLCGWCDVETESHDMHKHPVDCPMCWQIVDFCKAIKYRRRVRTG